MTGDADLSGVTQQQLVDLVLPLNSQPRKCLGYKTPADVFIAHLRESGRSPTLTTAVMHLD